VPTPAYASLTARFDGGIPSSVIERFNISSGDRVSILSRVSTSRQHGTSQAAHLSDAVERRRGTVLQVHQLRCSGRGEKWFADTLPGIVAIAKKLGATILLAASTDRFVRSTHFYPKSSIWNECQAQQHDLEELRFQAQGLRLMTFLDPDAPLSASKALLTRWGKSMRGKGRGRSSQVRELNRNQRREQLKWWVVKLREDHLSYDEIQSRVLAETGERLSISTIRYWSINP